MLKIGWEKLPLIFFYDAGYIYNKLALTVCIFKCDSSRLSGLIRLVSAKR